MKHELWQYMVVGFVVGGAVLWMLLRAARLIWHRGNGADGSSSCCGCPLDDACGGKPHRVKDGDIRLPQACQKQHRAKR